MSEGCGQGVKVETSKNAYIDNMDFFFLTDGAIIQASITVK